MEDAGGGRGGRAGDGGAVVRRVGSRAGGRRPRIRAGRILSAARPPRPAAVSGWSVRPAAVLGLSALLLAVPGPVSPVRPVGAPGPGAPRRRAALTVAGGASPVRTPPARPARMPRVTYAP